MLCHFCISDKIWCIVADQTHQQYQKKVSLLLSFCIIPLHLYMCRTFNAALSFVMDYYTFSHVLRHPFPVCSRAGSVLQVLPAVGRWLRHHYLPHLCGSVLPDTHPGRHRGRFMARQVQVSFKSCQKKTKKPPTKSINCNLLSILFNSRYMLACSVRVKVYHRIIC